MQIDTNWNIQFTESKGAMTAFNSMKIEITEQQKYKLFNARIVCCDSEYQIISGPDLMRDRIGFGSTIEEAVRDYIKAYSY